MATTIEAGLRITADTTQATAGVRGLGKEIGALPAGVAPAGKSFDDLTRKSAETAQRLRQTTQQLRQIGPQITDIVTGLAAGQNPLQVLLQQGGQLRDVFGGFGNAFRALAQVFTPLRLLALGTAGAIGTVAFQALQGARESDALQKSLALTGNAAAISAGQFDALASSQAAARKATIGDSREALAEVVASGQFTGAALATVHSAVLALGKLNGQTAAENLKLFTALADGVSAGAAKLNRQYNFLSIEQFKQIRILEAQGRTQEALRIVTEQFSVALETRINPNLGFFQRLWRDITKDASEALEIFKSLGRDKTLEDAIDALEKRLVKLRSLKFSAADAGGPRNAELIATLQAQLDNLQRTQAAERVGNAQRAAALREAQKDIANETKAFEDSLSAIAAAAAQKRLAQELAAIDARRAVVEQDHAAGLISEREFAARSSALELERLRAQRQALQATLASERAKLVAGGETQEQNAQKARVLQLEAQLVEMGSRMHSATAKAAAETGAAQLAAAREQAQGYAEVWQRAAGEVAQFAQALAASQARRLADPALRAQAEADAATAALRRQQADLERDLGNQIATSSPGQAAELQRQLDALRTTAAAAIAEADRAARLQSLAAQAGQAEALLRSREQAVALQVEQGQLSEAEGERQILDLRREQIPALERILALIEALASTAEERQVAADLRNAVTATKDLRTELEKTGRSQAIDGLASGLTDIVTRAKTGKEALMDMVAGFARAMLDVLNRKLAEQLVKQFTDAAGSGSSGGIFSAIGKGLSFVASLFHSGGVVGAGSGQMRVVSPLAFALAPRYHSGNTGDLMRRMGIGAGERAAVLKDDEEVLTANNPRHVRNFRGFGGVAITNNMTINGAQGDEDTQRASLDDLARTQEAAFNEWAVKQHRPGGLFARR